MRRGRVVLQAWEQRMILEKDAVVVTTRCARCRWELEGPVGVTRAAFAAHLKDDHPDVQPTTLHKRHRPTRQMVSTHNLDDNIATARAQGAAAWVTDA